MRIDKIRVKYQVWDWQNFKPLLLFFIFAITLSGIEGFYFVPYYKHNIISENLTKIGTLSIETWNSYLSLYTFFQTTVFFNNTVPINGFPDSLQAFYQKKEYIETFILPNYTRSLSYDLGNFTEEYRNNIIVRNSCDVIFNKDNYIKEEVHCDLFLDGLLTSNMMNTFKSLIVTVDTLIEEWKQKRHDWELVKTMFKTPEFVYIFAGFEETITSFYYWLTVKTLNQLNTEADVQETYDERIKSVYYRFIVPGFIIAFALTSMGTNILIVRMKTIIFLLPMKLLKNRKQIYLLWKIAIKRGKLL